LINKVKFLTHYCKYKYYISNERFIEKRTVNKNTYRAKIEEEEDYSFDDDHENNELLSNK